MILPWPLSWIKKSLKILKSNLTPNQIAFGFALGVFAGLPPTGLHVILPCTLALLARCSFRAFLFSFGLFKLLSLAVAPGSYAIGRWLLDPQRGLDAFWRFVFHIPVLAPMGYGRYLLLGSLVLSIAMALPVFFGVRFLVIRYRTSFVAWVSGWTLSRRMKDRRGLGLLRWALAGGGAKYETKRAPRGVFRIVRREMLIGLPVVYALCYLIAAVAVPFFAGTLTTSTASWIVGSEVSVDGASFSLFTGRLDLAGFSIQDPKASDENLVEIPSIRLDAGMIALLDKRVVFDNVVIADASLHVVREEDGTLNVDNATVGWNADAYVEWAAKHAKDVDWLGLLRQFVHYLSELEPLPPRGDPYARYRGGRSFPDFTSPFAVRRIEIGRVLLSLEDRLETDSPLPSVTLLEVSVSNLAFPPELRERPIHIELHGEFDGDPESGFSLAARFEAEDTRLNRFTASLTRVDLARIANLYRTTLPVEILSGRATMEAELELSETQAAGSVSLILENLELGGRSDRPLFGLSAETSDRVISGLNRYADDLPIVIGFPIGGAADAPTFEWEAPLLEVARDGLMMLGQRRLEETIESLTGQIAALGGVAPTSVLDPDYDALRTRADEAAQEIIRGIGGDGLLDDLPGAADTDGSNEEAVEPGITEILRRLLEGQDGAED